MSGTKQEQELVKPISRVVKNKLKFAKATICKISGPDHDFNDAIATFLAIGFNVEPTSGKMYDDVSCSFFQFFKVEPKEEAKI
jgi:hypothetical protein